MHSHYPINKLNSWRLGSTVRYFSQPETREQLIRVYSEFQHHRTIILGLGSNILFPDTELDAHLIRVNKALSNLYYNDSVHAESGVSLAKFAKFCSKQGFEDAVFLAGIPGTVGGALQMNAGAYGHEIWRYVKSVEVLTLQGIERWLPSDFQVCYRRVIPSKPMCMFISAEFCFLKGSAIEAKKKMKQYLLKRNQTQPIGTFNCGSVFKNPDQNSAGKLIDQLGLLGYQVGSARVSPKHGNFIENIGGQASSKDILAVMNDVQKMVKDTYGIQLKPEVTIYE